MKKATEKQAIKECKELWEAIEKSGLNKNDFLDTTKEGKVYKDKDYWGDCPLCEYAGRGGSGCDECPLVVKYGKRCTDLGYTIRGSLATEEFFTAVRGL